MRDGMIDRLNAHAEYGMFGEGTRRLLREAAEELRSLAPSAGEAVAWIEATDLEAIRNDPDRRRMVRGKAAFNSEIPLYLAPTAARVVDVTDAMVNRACAAHDPVGWKIACGETTSDMRHNMREALQAAFEVSNG